MKLRLIGFVVFTIAAAATYQNCGSTFALKAPELAGVKALPVRSAASAATVTPVTLADPNLIVGTFYYPGWNKDEAGGANGVGSQWAWDHLVDFPEREPMQGWYKEGDPVGGAGARNARLQIKRARENGINLFVFNWFRKKTTTDPYMVAPELGSALHNGFLQVNDGATGMKFALNFTFEEYQNEGGDDWKPENRIGLITPFANAGKSNLLVDQASHQLANVLYPYWRSTYFNRGDYQRINGRPVMFFLGMSAMLRYFGAPKPAVGTADDIGQLRIAAARMRLAITAVGVTANSLGDIHPPVIGCSIDSFVNPAGSADRHRQLLEVIKAAGCDFHYEYGNSSITRHRPEPIWQSYADLYNGEPAEPNLALIHSLYESGQGDMFSNAFGAYAQYRNWLYFQKLDPVLPSLATITVGWNDDPWSKNHHSEFFKFRLMPKPLETVRYNDPTSFYGLLSQFRYKTQTEPTFSRVGGVPILLIGSWNEYGEGHYIEPTKNEGFQYLEVLRYVLGRVEDRASFPVNKPEDL